MSGLYNTVRQMLQDKPELRKEIAAELERLGESGGTISPDEALAKTFRKILNLDITAGDLAKARAEIQELDPEELKKALGGESREDNDVCATNYSCYFVLKHPDDPRRGEACFWDWTCFGVYNCVKGPN